MLRCQKGTPGNTSGVRFYARPAVAANALPKGDFASLQPWPARGSARDG